MKRRLTMLWVFLTAMAVGAAVYSWVSIDDVRRTSEAWRHKFIEKSEAHNRLVTLVSDLQKSLEVTAVRAKEQRDHDAAEIARLTRELALAEASVCRPLPKFGDGLRMH